MTVHKASSDQMLTEVMNRSLRGLDYDRVTWSDSANQSIFDSDSAILFKTRGQIGAHNKRIICKGEDLAL